jgi:hypothetical protein
MVNYIAAGNFMLTCHLPYHTYTHSTVRYKYPLHMYVCINWYKSTQHMLPGNDITMDMSVQFTVGTALLRPQTQYTIEKPHRTQPSQHATPVHTIPHGDSKQG